MTTKEKGWQALANGYLIAAAEQEGFELLITCDQSLRYQQNLQGRKLMILILLSNNWPRVRKMAAQIATTVDFMQTGQVRELDISKLS